MTPPSVPHIIGYQSAGEIIEVGAQVDSFRVGDRVVTFDFAGSHAERRAVPAKYVWRVPEGVGVEEASVVPVAFGTAYVALFKEAKLAPGETVLVQAGASGVGLAAIQLAKQAGPRCSQPPLPKPSSHDWSRLVSIIRSITSPMTSARSS